MASSQMSPVILQTNFPGLKLRGRGKVRDIYEVGDRLLIVATDRLSAFDVVFPTPIPDKGRVLTQLSLFWFEKLAAVIPNHVISATDFSGELAPYAASLDGRAMLVRRTEPVPIECVVRGYISGSGWKDYQKTGAICGIPLPAGLRESDRLPDPIFTPSTKATTRPRRKYFVRGNRCADRTTACRKIAGREPDVVQARDRARRCARHHSGRYEIRIWTTGR